MRQLALDHLALPIADARATLHFYRDLLGLTLADAISGDDWGGRPWLMMIFALGDGREIALVKLRGADARTTPLAQELPHFALAAADHGELDAWRRKLADAGVTISEEEHGPRRSIYFADPNGIVLEITAPPTRAGGDQSASARAVRVVDDWLKTPA